MFDEQKLKEHLQTMSKEQLIELYIQKSFETWALEYELERLKGKNIELLKIDE